MTRTEVTAINSFGVKFRLHPNNYIDDIVLREGYYETEVVEALRTGLPQGAVVWDVGANFGLHSVTLKVLRPDLRIIAFEPSPREGARVLDNAELNDVAVDLVNMGLGERAQIALLHTAPGNPGMNTFYPWSATTYGITLRSYVDSGDRLVEAGVVPTPFAVKIDVEGGESAALQGLSRTIASSLRRLVIEGGPDTPAELNTLGFTTVKMLGRMESSHHALSNFLAER